jgi:hypothetical protein
MIISINNIRTFCDHHEIPIARLTVLTGENSAGKTTFLSVIAALFDERFPFSPPFDTPPYSLGSYDTIATYKGGRYGRAKEIGIGFKDDTDSHEKVAYRSYAKYESRAGRVSLVELDVERGRYRLHLSFKDTKNLNISNAKATLEMEDGKRMSFDIELPMGLDEQSGTLSFQNALISGVFKKRGVEEPVPGEYFEGLMRLSNLSARIRAVSVAPIRTRPERTYSQAKQAFEPTGDHIPFVLDRLFTDDPSRSERHQITRALEQFGRESSLFESVSIKKLGTKSTDPFQVMIKLAGRSRNLIDVGYGVSQALPVVAQTVLENPNRMILMQQPEVHLHPKAQAALGSFFCQMVKAGKRTLVIETHSDFIVDRIRQEVASGVIPPEWVRVLFFHRDEYDTTVYPLRIDEEGNILDAPDFYRDFFLREELRLLERGSK